MRKSSQALFALLHLQLMFMVFRFNIACVATTCLLHFVVVLHASDVGALVRHRVGSQLTVAAITKYVNSALYIGH